MQTDNKIHLAIIQDNDASTPIEQLDTLEAALNNENYSEDIFGPIKVTKTVKEPAEGETLSKFEQKQSVSFSEILTWLECNHKHYLKYVLGLGLDGPNEYTEFGQVIHDGIETRLKTGEFPLEENLKKDFRDRMVNVKPKNPITEKDWDDQLYPIVLSSIPLLNKELGENWEVVNVEEKLLEDISGNPYKFKGYIDAIFKVPSSKKKGEFIYWIIDWKSCENFWSPMKERDYKKQLQLVLYKFYWASKNNIPLENVKCGFVLFRRKMPKNSNERCKLVQVGVGPKKIEQSKDILWEMTANIKKGFHTKTSNKDNCKYCPYLKTEQCP